MVDSDDEGQSLAITGWVIADADRAPKIPYPLRGVHPRQIGHIGPFVHVKQRCGNQAALNVRIGNPAHRHDRHFGWIGDGLHNVSLGRPQASAPLHDRTGKTGAFRAASPTPVDLPLMSHRIDIELTSDRGDGSWTWRAAGARQPKGVVSSSLLPAGAQVGDVMRADAESDADGISLVAVQPPKQRNRSEAERIEIIGSNRSEPGVTTQLAGGRRRRDDDDDRPRGRGRTDGDRRGPRSERGTRPSSGGQTDRRRAAPRREGPPARPERPRAPRLRAGRTHRQALLAQLPTEQRPVCELVLRGGVPLVRETLEIQRKAAEASGIPVVKAGPVIDVAEKLAPHARLAEWQDRADAALAQAAEVDLRDLRSVVVAADGVARHEQTRQTADDLRKALASRVDAEQRAWSTELAELVEQERSVAALRLSSRPPKAGVPLPPALATSLAQLVVNQLGPETSAERYCTVLEALALSPVRTQVVPASVPDAPAQPIIEAVRRLGDRIPQIAAAFGVEPAPPTRNRRGPRRPGSVTAAVPPPPTTP